MFICLEGIDGTGKTYQCQQLKKYFESQNIPVVITHAPGGTLECEKLRKFLLDPNTNIGGKTQALIFQAVNAEICEKIIAPALKQNQIVISDRWTDSAIAYQGLTSGYTKDEIETLCNLACQPIKPDLVFLFDGNPENLLARRQKRNIKDRFEEKNLEFQKQLRKIYLNYHNEIPHIIINAEQTKKEVTKNIIKEYENFIEKKQNSIKEITKSDIQEIEKLYKNAPEKEFHEYLEYNRLFKKNAKGYGLFHNGKLIATAFFINYKSQKIIYSYAEYTAPEYRNKGYIKKLLQYEKNIFENFFSKGYKWLLNCKNPQSFEFHKKYGKEISSTQQLTKEFQRFPEKL